MIFKIDESKYGFKLLEEKYIEELKSTGRVFKHEKTGARLFHLENEDDNKVFSIGFRTPPTDSTGVAHIVEHSVLSGSRKYTTKEPFMDMVKGSLQTFINAMTFADKTIYPIASRNKKDFYNLMDVYLDAVFFPKIYEKKEIFMQEGWHHEIFDKNKPIEYTGVVYNEMQGAYSSPESLLNDMVSASLYPDTCYKYSSGGNPQNIPDLSYEDFLDFHKRYYHPSNSYIFLYGNGDISEDLQYIDENYLNAFDALDIDSHIEPQKKFENRVETVEYYNLPDEEDEKNKTFLTMNFVLGENSDPITNIMSSLLDYILISSAASPLKKSLLDNGIGEDIFPISAGGLQISFGVVAKNTNAERKDDFEKNILDTLNELVTNGIDRDLIKAGISHMEYILREASGFPTKGLIYLINSFDSWLYNDNPYTLLEYNKTIEFLKEQLDTDFYEKYIEDNLINNPHSSIVTVKPQKGLTQERINDNISKLEKFKSSLSEDELNSLIKDNEDLKTMQLTDDTLEDKLTIPRLSIEDIERNALDIPQEIIKEDNYTILNHNIFTSNISYMDFIFDTTMVTKEELPYINILTLLLGELDTKNYKYADLDNEIYMNTGGISFTSQNFPNKDNDTIFYPKLNIRTKTTEENIRKAMELISETIFNTKLDNKKRIMELLNRTKSRIEMSIFQAGHGVVSSRVASYYSPRMKYDQIVNGLDYYWFVSNLVNNFEEKYDEILENLNNLYNKIFNKNNLIISFTGDKADFDKFVKEKDIILNKLNNEEFIREEYNFEDIALNEGIKSISNVQYVAKGYNFKNLGYEYSGTMNVLSTILNGSYLHNRVRAQGGAYGVGMGTNRTGSLTISSYRDPNLVNTLETYDNMYKFVEEIELSEMDLTNYIIGAIGSMDPALTPSAKGSIGVSRYISGISIEDVQKTKNQVIDTTVEDIKSMAPMLKELMDKNYICVLGNDKIIEENKEVFDNIENLNK